MRLDTGLGCTFWLADAEMADIEADQPRQPSRVSVDADHAVTVWLDADEDGRKDVEVLIVERDDASEWDDVTELDITCPNGLQAMSHELQQQFLPIVTSGGAYRVRIRHRVDPSDELETFGFSVQPRG